MMKSKLLYLLIGSIAFFTNSCVIHHDKQFIDNRIEKAINGYIKDNNEYQSLLIMSSCHFYNEGKEISGVLVGPMYEGILHFIDNHHINNYIDYSGKIIYIDSEALYITNGCENIKNNQILSCEQDSFILYENANKKYYEKSAYVNYIKRAILLDFRFIDDTVNDLNVRNADSLYLPKIRCDAPLLPE